VAPVQLRSKRRRWGPEPAERTPPLLDRQITSREVTVLEEYEGGGMRREMRGGELEMGMGESVSASQSGIGLNGLVDDQPGLRCLVSLRQARTRPLLPFDSRVQRELNGGEGAKGQGAC